MIFFSCMIRDKKTELLPFNDAQVCCKRCKDCKKPAELWRFYFISELTVFVRIWEPILEWQYLQFGEMMRTLSRDSDNIYSLARWWLLTLDLDNLVFGEMMRTSSLEWQYICIVRWCINVGCDMGSMYMCGELLANTLTTTAYRDFWTFDDQPQGDKPSR